MYGGDTLLFLETQGIAGYSSELKKDIYYSHHEMEVMQKPSVGIDLVQRLSSSYRSWGLFAFQGRVAYDTIACNNTEIQIYNAYLKYKTENTDVWIGHNKPCFGLAYLLDNHGYLMQSLFMEGFGFDRDWGMGLVRPYDKGEITASLTLGSGMPVYYDNNYLASSRVSFGVLEKDNMTIGLSASYGNVVNTMGYHRLQSDLIKHCFGGADFSWNIYAVEIKLEAITGKMDNIYSYGNLIRFGFNFLEESALKIEVQPIILKLPNTDSNIITYGEVSYRINADIAVRSMYSYDNNNDEYNLIGQIYYYKSL